MIRTLRKKFILTAMMAVSILLIVLIGAINAVNCLAEISQAEQFLKIVTGPTDPAPRDASEERNGIAGRLFRFPAGAGEERMHRESYFIVSLENGGTVIRSDVSHISGVSEAEAAEYAASALEKGEMSGRDGRFFYRVEEYSSGDVREYTVAFVDFSERMQSILRILFLSAVIGLFCWLLMFLLVFLLSERAIRPVAESMERQKQFVTDAGHEIKTPLAIILSNTDALELHNGESRWSRNIRAQTVRLNGLMQNLLTLAGIEESAGKPEAADLCVSDLLRETIQPFYEPACAKNISFRENIESGVMMRGNREQLVRLFSVLTDNAVKYADEGGEAEVSLQRTERGEILLRFWNTCTTRPEGDPEKWFDRFYRGDSARTQKSGGYGIGLSVARAVAEAHGGFIDVDIREGSPKEANPKDSSGGEEGGAVVTFTVKLQDSGKRMQRMQSGM